MAVVGEGWHPKFLYSVTAHPGGVQGRFRRCVEGHGLVRTVADRWMVGLMIP